MTVKLTPETNAEVLTAVVTMALIAPATVGYLSLLEGWEPYTASEVAIFVCAWLVVTLQRLFREEFAVGLVTGTAMGAAFGWTYYGV